MGVKIRRGDGQQKLKEMAKASRNLDGRKLRVGVMEGGELGMIAHVHEFGCDIKVTDKMRGYLGSQGIHLKKETTVIRIPERSFIRAGFDAKEGEWRNKVDDILQNALTGGIPIESALDMLGLDLGKIQEFARDLSSPPNSATTVKLKGSSNPLVDTGRLIGAIKHEVD
ncbi:hypothetical protein OVA29_08695 [Exiguobacterium sp. SL14]|nr:hypothetical protein [Exiguobacterium sp. SL14]MCY1690733.1 hypothetical protein [Exiguobacterium sp. SL14]